MIEIKNLHKQFHLNNTIINAVDDVTLSIEEGDIYGIIGYSGAGKSTLIRCLNLLEKYDSGEVIVAGEELKSLSKSQLLKKRESIGMIFQHFNLLQSSTVYENIASPLKNTKGYSKEAIKQRVHELLKLVDLEDKINAYPSQLSGGQKQRVAIARALSRHCSILLCDEATSALDPNTTHSILSLLKKINQELGVTIVLITHQMEVVKTICNKIAVMENGKVVEKGNLLDVFFSPTHPTTKQFVEQSQYPDELESVLKNHEHVYSLSFVGEVVDQPILSNLQKQLDINVNILFGNIEFLVGRKIGNMIVELTGTQIQEAISVLKKQGVQVKEIK